MLKHVFFILAPLSSTMSPLSSIFLLINYFLPFLSGELAVYTLCLNTVGNVGTANTGNIQYVKSDIAMPPCDFTLSGFGDGGHVSIPGIDQVTISCPIDVAKLTINGLIYCATLKESSNKALISSSKGQVQMSLETAPNNFSLDYYTNSKLLLIIYII